MISSDSRLLRICVDKVISAISTSPEWDQSGTTDTKFWTFNWCRTWGQYESNRSFIISEHKPSTPMNEKHYAKTGQGTSANIRKNVATVEIKRQKQRHHRRYGLCVSWSLSCSTVCKYLLRGNVAYPLFVFPDYFRQSRLYVRKLNRGYRIP